MYRRMDKRAIENKEIYLKKKIYEKVTEGMFDMSNVRIFKEVEKKQGMFILCYVFG